MLKQTSHKGQLKTTLCSFSDEVKLHCLKPAKTGELKDKTLLILQIKEPVILPAEWIYLGIAKGIAIWERKLWQTIGKSREQGRELAFIEERGELEEAAPNEMISLEVIKSLRWWQLLIGWAAALLIGWAVARRGENLPSSCWSNKVETSSCPGL